MCKTCGPTTQAKCDACSLVFGDETFKEVVWCADCKAWICKGCENNWGTRSAAYFLRKAEQLGAAVKGAWNKLTS